MREALASLVHPVFRKTLELRERLEKGENPDLQAEQASLKGLLQIESEARRLVDFGGESPVDAIQPATGRVSGDNEMSGDAFLGVRYALACWIDEFFILHTPWGGKWNERKIEVDLYGTNDRAWKFWRQAERARLRPDNDALEVFFLCVLLGFRGELRDAAEQLQEWVSNVKTRIAKIRSQDWPYPVEYEPPTHVPPQFGREQLARMILTGGTVLLLLVPVVAFLFVKRLGQ